MNDFDTERPDHLGDAPLRDAPHDLDLSPAQMGMDDPEGDGKVIVGCRLGEGDLMLVPMQGDRGVQRQAAGRDGGQPVGQADRPTLARVACGIAQHMAAQQAEPDRPRQPAAQRRPRASATRWFRLRFAFHGGFGLDGALVLRRRLASAPLCGRRPVPAIIEARS